MGTYDMAPRSPVMVDHQPNGCLAVWSERHAYSSLPSALACKFRDRFFCLSVDSTLSRQLGGLPWCAVFHSVPSRCIEADLHAHYELLPLLDFYDLGGLRLSRSPLVSLSADGAARASNLRTLFSFLLFVST